MSEHEQFLSRVGVQSFASYFRASIVSHWDSLDNSEPRYVARMDAPDCLLRMIREVEPDDLGHDEWRMKFIVNALDAIMEMDSHDDALAVATENVGQGSNAENFDWLSSHRLRSYYCDEYHKEFRSHTKAEDFNLNNLIEMGMWWEANQVFESVWNFLDFNLPEYAKNKLGDLNSFNYLWQEIDSHLDTALEQE